ncbi:MAG: FtsQ-type POTRA domain-containing protein [Chitinivibrionales bacterium]|nr:FtsQ-type POTRA domain-containing protein [Chitinivibrionales bacterium]
MRRKPTNRHVVVHPKTSQIPPVKRRSRNRRFMVFMLRAFVILGCIGVLSYLSFQKVKNSLAQLEFFKIESVHVRGIRYLDTTEVIAASGVKTGNSLFSLQFGQIEKRLKELGWVYSVSWWFTLPNTLVLRIHERQPVAYIHMGSVYLVDETGAVLPVRIHRGWNIPLFVGLHDTLGQNKTRILTSASLQRMKTYFKQSVSMKKETARTVSQVEFKKDQTLVLRFESLPTQVEVQEKQLTAALQKFEQVILFVKKNGGVLPGYINLSYANVAFVQQP